MINFYLKYSCACYHIHHNKWPVNLAISFELYLQALTDDNLCQQIITPDLGIKGVSLRRFLRAPKTNVLTLYILGLFADNLCNQFGPRPGRTKCQGPRSQLTH